jgi:hypothetical protein
MNPDDEFAEIKREDSTPSILEQANTAGWKAEYYNWGKAEGDGADMFNPALIERPDGIWMITRRSEPHPQGFRFGQNKVWAFLMDETGKVPRMGKLLKWPNSAPDQHFEDPRGFYHPGVSQTCVGACTFIWYPDRTWTGAIQCFGMFDEQWECKKMDFPVIGGNPDQMTRIDRARYEKNWLWWLHDDRLHLLYKAAPWLVVGFGRSWKERQEYKHNGVFWPYGDIRGGTSPVRVGDYYFTFHHSSLPWKGRYRRYYTGALAFESKPPFTPKMITPEPLLIGSQNDTWTQRKPLVIFPCGALFRNGKWLISAGVNDIKSAWIEIDHDSLLSRMRPIDDVSSPIFSANGLSEGELTATGKDLSGGVESRHAEMLPAGESAAKVDHASHRPLEPDSGSSAPPAQKPSTRKARRRKITEAHREKLRASLAKARARRKELSEAQ